MIPVQTDFQIPYTTNGNERSIEGEVRAINGQLKVFDGSAWVQTVDSIDLGTVVDWAKQKMEQELREAEMAEQFPAFANTKENYELIRRLVENEVA